MPRNPKKSSLSLVFEPIMMAGTTFGLIFLVSLMFQFAVSCAPATP